jgi:hypothetical protein
MMSNPEGAAMASQRVSGLTRKDIISTAHQFQWRRQMPKWTVVVEGRELPARPLVLQAAKVPPNDPTNSHQAVAILFDWGFDIRYEGKPVQNVNQNLGEQTVLLDLIDRLCGCCKGGGLLEEREREHRIE